MEKEFTEFDQQRFVDIIRECNRRSSEKGSDLGLDENGFVTFVPFVTPSINQLSTFPIEMFPSVIKDYSMAVAESLQVSIDMVAVAILGIMALCLQGEFYVQPKEDWKEPLNLYILVIARPSERKSPTMKEITDPVYKYAEEVNKEKRPEISEYLIKKDILSKKVDSLKKAVVGNKKNTSVKDVLAAQKELDELEEVTPLRIIVDDVTTEALVKIMEENDERISIVTAEGGIFGMMAGSYNNQPNIDIFLKSYSGEPYSSDRIGRKGESINNPLLTLLIMTQPVVASDAMQNKEFRERGLLARFLYSLPSSIVGKRRYNSKPINPNIRKAYKDLVNNLLSLRDWKFETRTIRFSKEANILSESFANEIEGKLLDDYEEIEDWAGKFHGQTMRIAAILHCVKHLGSSPTTELSRQTMNEAIRIGRYFLDHAIAAFQIAGLTEEQGIKDAKYILKCCDKRDKCDKSIKKRDLFRLCRRFKTVDEMKPGLDELISHGYIRIYKDNSSSVRSSDIIEINPEYELQKVQKEGVE